MPPGPRSALITSIHSSFSVAPNHLDSLEIYPRGPSPDWGSVMICYPGPRPRRVVPCAYDAN